MVVRVGVFNKRSWRCIKLRERVCVCMCVCVCVRRGRRREGGKEKRVNRLACKSRGAFGKGRVRERKRECGTASLWRTQEGTSRVEGVRG